MVDVRVTLKMGNGPADSVYVAHCPAATGIMLEQQEIIDQISGQLDAIGSKRPILTRKSFSAFAADRFCIRGCGPLPVKVRLIVVMSRIFS